jgi:Holliday junction resolvasome RuvABC ATP-dependent DNA helicase subunit
VIEAIAATLGEERDTLEDVVERIAANRFVRRTKTRREITRAACDHLNIKLKVHKKETSDAPLF